MSNIASSLTGSPPVPVQNNRGKTSSNSQGGDGAFAKQLSENKPASSRSSQNSAHSVNENSHAVEADVLTESGHPVEKIKLDYEFDPDTYVTNPEVELDLDLDQLEVSPELEANDIDHSLTGILTEVITVSPEETTQSIDEIILATDGKPAPIDQGIIAKLNQQLNSKVQSTENKQILKPELNDVKAQNAPLSPNSKVANLGGIMKPASEDVVAVSALNPSVDIVKTSNVQNSDVGKLPVNSAILANSANGGTSSDKGADQQKDGGSNQFVNQVDRAGIKVEGVDVLQARVFPAISQSNGINIANALTNTHQLGGQAALQNAEPIYSTPQTKMINTLKIQLVPANLGVVTAVMKLTGEELQVQLQVDNVEAYRKLSADSASIVNTLKNQGFGIEQVNVQLMSGDRGFAQQGQQQNGQSFQGQAEQEASSNFDRERRESNSTNSDSQSQELGNHESDILPTPQVIDLSNGVYL